MNLKSYNFFVLFLGILSFVSAQRYTYSPYFESEEGLELKHSKVKVEIIGMIASIEVSQKYTVSQNIDKATYKLPISNKSSLSYLRIKNDSKILETQISKREKSRSMFVNAKKNGKLKSFFKMDRNKAFELIISDLKAEKEIDVKFHYTEKIAYHGGEYHFNFPLLIQPKKRISKKIHSKNTDFELELISPISIKKTSSFSHLIELNKLDDFKQTIHFSKQLNSKKTHYNLNYKLSDKKVESGVLTTKYGKDKFFLAMLNPPQRENAKTLAKEYIFLIDMSGSMEGFPNQAMEKIIHKTLSKLNEKDKFNLIYFAQKSNLLFAKSVFATAENKQKAQRSFQSKFAYGGTNLFDAMGFAIASPKTKAMARNFVILTDGQLLLKPEDYRFLKENRSHANFFLIGLGPLVNRKVLKSLSYISNSKAFIVEEESELEPILNDFILRSTSVIASDISYKFKGVKVHNTEDYFGDLFLDKPLFILGHYNAQRQGELLINFENNQGKKQLKSTFYKSGSLSNLIPKYWAEIKTKSLKESQARTKIHQNKIQEISDKYKIANEYSPMYAVRKEKDEIDFSKLIQNKMLVKELIKQDLSGINHQLKSIEFDLASHRILDKYHPILNDAFYVLKLYEAFRFELIGHTDCQGSSLDNKELSRKRAMEVKKYLVRKGINSERLIIIPKGESEPIKKCNICSECSQEIHRKNRRLEFKTIL